jgi:periplasmic copper chaperone A
MMSVKQLLGVGVLWCFASTYVHAEVKIENAYVRASLPATDSTAAYMTLRNADAKAVVISSLSSPAAGKVTMHSTMNHNGMLHMMGVATLTIPANGELKLSPSGNHVMLEAVTTPLIPGAEVELTLHFADGQHQVMRLPVRSVLDE